LLSQGINISVSTIDFARYDFEARGLEAVARASVHYYNTEDELARLVDAVATAPRA
jgi:selenocysteine lyase/cysteine desulfurase